MKTAVARRADRAGARSPAGAPLARVGGRVRHHARRPVALLRQRRVLQPGAAALVLPAAEAARPPGLAEAGRAPAAEVPGGAGKARAAEIPVPGARAAEAVRDVST